MLELLHGVNAQNEITSITTDDGSAPETVDPTYDANGSLVFDGQYYHQYDAWNRLVQVNAAHVDAGTGQIVIDELIKHHTYDGLGRQIRTQSPYPDPSAQTGDVRTERFFYDGVRRIQELVLDPVVATGPAAASSDRCCNCWRPSRTRLGRTLIRARR